jgi:hypothetical protein
VIGGTLGLFIVWFFAEPPVLPEPPPRRRAPDLEA